MRVTKPTADPHPPGPLSRTERVKRNAQRYPALFYTLPRRKPGPIVPRHEPIPARKASRLLQEVPSGGRMDPGFRREGEGKFVRGG